ncbi:hypothetical protein Gotur_001219 [Gossypium turneri]
MDSLCETVVSGVCFKEGEIPTKVRFRDKDENESSSSRSAGFVLESNEDFKLLAGDVQKSFINSIPSIKFSDRIQHIHIRDIENTVILKLLGRNIGFSILHSKIYNLWKPSAPFHLMDIENGYFLARLDNKVDYKKEVCPSRVSEPNSVKQPPPSSTLTEMEKIIVNGLEETGETYEPWMLVESKSRRKTRDLSKIAAKIMAENNEASRYRALIETYHNSGSKSCAED